VAARQGNEGGREPASQNVGQTDLRLGREVRDIEEVPQELEKQGALQSLSFRNA
jgi:hypothetical protein